MNEIKSERREVGGDQQSDTLIADIYDPPPSTFQIITVHWKYRDAHIYRLAVCYVLFDELPIIAPPGVYLYKVPVTICRPTAVLQSPLSSFSLCTARRCLVETHTHVRMRPVNKQGQLYSSPTVLCIAVTSLYINASKIKLKSNQIERHMLWMCVLPPPSYNNKLKYNRQREEERKRREQNRRMEALPCWEMSRGKHQRKAGSQNGYTYNLWTSYNQTSHTDTHRHQEAEYTAIKLGRKIRFQRRLVFKVLLYDVLVCSLVLPVCACTVRTVSLRDLLAFIHTHHTGRRQGGCKV